MRGWFDMFREDGGPTLYSHSNRTPVFGDVTTVTVCIAFGTLYAAFFIIFPGIRTEVGVGQCHPAMKFKTTIFEIIFGYLKAGMRTLSP